MCGLIEAVRQNPPARSLAAIRPREVTGIDIEPHGPWTADEQRKIEAYVNQLELPGLGGGPRTALVPLPLPGAGLRPAPAGGLRLGVDRAPVGVEALRLGDIPSSWPTR
jgi:hypothetical protein